MRKVGLLVLIAVLCLMGGCAKKVTPGETPFDLEQAQDLVLRIEKPVLGLNQVEKISRIEYDAIKKQMEAFLQDQAATVVDLYFNSEDLADATKLELDVLQDNFYPTILHQGFELTDAKWVNVEQEDGTIAEKLVIREEYKGENEVLKGFYREYTFKKDQDAFYFESFDGTLNYMGEEYIAFKNELK